MSSVYFCPECGKSWGGYTKVPSQHWPWTRRTGKPCPGTPIDVLAERERLLADNRELEEMRANILAWIYRTGRESMEMGGRT